MKKIFLMLLLGISLTSLAGATVTVSTNSTRPVFYANLVKDDGTNQLEAGSNYYFQCFVGGYGYYGMSASPASEEFNVTTNSTHRWINISNIQPMCNSYTINTGDKGVLCRWSINRSFKDWGGEGYMPASFSNNESPNYQYWLAKYGRPGQYFAPNFRCSRGKDEQTITSADLYQSSGYSSAYIFHPEISILLSEKKFLDGSAINTSKGVADVYIDGTGNTYGDLANAFIDSGNGDMAAITKESIKFLGNIYGSGDITFSGKNIMILGGNNWDANLNFTEASSLTLYPMSNNRWNDIRGSFYNSKVRPYGINVLSYMEGNNIDFTLMKGSMTHYSPSDGWTFNAKLQNSQHQTRYSKNYTVTNNVYNRVFERLVISLVPGDSSITVYENDTFNDITRSYDIYFDTYYDKDDCNVVNGVELINTISNRENKRVKVYNPYDDSVGQACGSKYYIDAYFDVKVKLKDKYGNPIENANVSLIGEDNVSKLTDSNGEAVLRVKTYGYNANYSAYNHMDFFDYRTYNLKITKDGYQDYETEVFIDDKKDWTIALLENVGGGTTVICDSVPDLACGTGKRLVSSKDYPYLNYKISPESDTTKGILLNPYIIRTDE